MSASLTDDEEVLLVPLTQQNFRPDPRRRVFVEALLGFWLDGRKDPVQPGEVLEIAWSDAVQLFHSNKAVQCDGPARAAPKAPTPPAHAPATTVAAEPAKSSKG